MWVIDDGDGSVVRVSARTGRVVKRIVVGDGPADLAFTATQAWAIDHRDRRLWRIDLATNAATRLATIGGENEAPERMTLLGGSLWITRRWTHCGACPRRRAT